jgi:chemotaxis protein CheX
MNVQYINPFIIAASSVLEVLLGEVPQKGEIFLQAEASTSNQCNVVLGITGQIQGQVIYGMSTVTADRIVSKMLGQEIKIFDQLAASAIGEMGNMISGHAMQHLHTAGFVCDITPPTIIRANNVKISTLSIPAVVIPLKLPQGDLSITVGLAGRK